MSANDYYNSSYSYNHDTSYHGAGNGRQDVPLPPLPPSSTPKPYTTPLNTSAQDISPIHSPFEDHAYPASTGGHGYGYDNISQTSQSGRYSTSKPYGDPFGDQHAIPLQSQKPGKGIPGSPTSANGDAERQFRKRKGKGWFTGKIPFVVYTLSLVQLAVFIAELARNGALTKTPIEIHPTFNPMIGPSPYVLINMGARYVPCMRKYDIPGRNETIASPDVFMPCPNATTNDAHCHLADLCGFGLNLDVKPDGTQPQPNQWYRFITPIFLHGGIIHVAFNLLLQLTLGRDMEIQIGPLRFVLVYFSAGIFGFVFGGNFAPSNLPSTGCSGAIFGILALVLLDLLYKWKTRRHPGRELAFILLDVVIAFVIGLLPGLDNFSHIGGFMMGLCLGICILHSPDSLRERIGLDEPPYATVGRPDGVEIDHHEPTKTGLQSFVSKPVGFFKGRKPLWWAWWLLRAFALVGVLVAFIVLLRNFYVFRNQCSWCKYLSCLPIKNWCDVGNLNFTPTETTPARLFRRLEPVF